MLEQRRLADPRLAAYDEHTALARPDGREQVVDELTLVLPSAQLAVNGVSKRQDVMLVASEPDVKRLNIAT